jgi:folate-binding protein YgfZ
VGGVMQPSAKLNAERLSQLRDGAVMVRTPASIIEVQGAGALQCLQGLLTNDLAGPGDGSVVYTALLTQKGMITADMWVLRLRAQRLVMVGDPQGRRPMTMTFGHSLPPRLAQATDLSDTREALWLMGDLAIAALAAAGFRVPDGESRVIATGQGAKELLVSRPQTLAHFRALLVASPEALERSEQALTQAGVIPGSPEDLEAGRILAGWPRLGAEIRDKTLPQEVRYDEIQGLSYTKGCYLGQETVARLHFRGHTNRELRGLIWHGAPELENETVLGPEGQILGTVGSILVLPNVTVGLAILRREANPGTVVSTGGHYARVVPLPFASLSSYT